MAHDPRKLLFDMIEACKKVIAFTAGLSFEQFTSNALVKSAVLYDNIPEADRTIAFRHVIAHDYDVIVDEIVWEIIEEKIPVLLNEAQRLFNT